MALKFELDSLDGLAPEIAKEYKPKDGGGFILDTDGESAASVAKLKGALTLERQQRKDATEKVTALTTERDELAVRAGKPNELEAAYKKKVEDTKAESAEAIKKRDAQIRKMLVDNEAAKLAAEISTLPKVLLPHILKRMDVEEVGGEFVVRVLGDDGKITANSLEDLRKEFVANADYAGIIKASNASGGGAQGGSSRPGGAKALKDMTEGEKRAFLEKDPEGFKREAAALKTTPPASAA